MRRDKWRRRRREHAKIRAAERHQMRLTNQDLTNIVGMIENRKVVASRRISSTKSAVLVNYQDQRMTVIYSRKHREIITILPTSDRYARSLEAACD